MENQTSSGAQEGFSINDIGVLQDLRDAITSPEWSSGDPSVILQVADKLDRRISSNFTEHADLIKIFETLQNKFVLIAQKPVIKGYSNTYPVVDSALAGSALRNNIWKSAWHNTVANIASDIDDTIKMLEDFQNLFSGGSEDDLSVITDFETGSFDIQIGKPSSIPSTQQATGFNGVTAQRLLSGENYSTQNTSSQLFEQRSSFYGLSSALERINTSIKSVIASADALDQSKITNFTNTYSLLDSDPGDGFGSFITTSAGVAVDSRDQNIRAILGGDVTTDLTNSFNKTTFSPVQVVERVEGALNPDSVYFNADFAQSIRDTLIVQQDAISQSSTSSAQGDLDGDGAVTVNDLLAFLTVFGSVVDTYSVPSEGLTALQSLITAVEAEDDVAFSPIAGDIYTPVQGSEYDGFGQQA
jgi:hypothetical protein